MADGLDNKSTAEILVVTYATVRGHVQKIFDKLNAHSKIEAVALANKYDLLTPT